MLNYGKDDVDYNCCLAAVSEIDDFILRVEV